jgi:hypothetical protein
MPLSQRQLSPAHTVRAAAAAAAAASAVAAVAVVVAVAALAALAAVAVSPVTAQVQAPAPPVTTARVPAGAISGVILDVETGGAVAGALVVLEPDVPGLFAAGRSAAFAVAARAVVTEADGAYLFAQLAPGAYRLRVARSGYHPYELVVELRAAAESPVAIGLTADPIPLRPLELDAYRRSLYGRDRSGPADVEAGRIAAVLARQRSYLPTDVRELTHADVAEAATLGETDPFRALQRLPGAATRSDYTAELWTRGGTWSLTRVYFDGVPLFNPLHALGSVGGISSGGIGGLWFHPGVRPAGLGEGAAGVIDLRSRRGGGDLSVLGDLSLAGASVAADRGALDGRAAWLVSGRRTTVDWLDRIARRATGEAASYPHRFMDLLVRGDLELGAGGSIEASGFWEQDDMEAASGVGRGAWWGNAAGRLSHDAAVSRFHLRHDVAFSRYRGVVKDSALIRPIFPVPGPWPRPPAEDGSLRADGWPGTDSEVRHVSARAQLSPAAAEPGLPRWRGGWLLQREEASYRGPSPAAVPRQASFVERTDGSFIFGGAHNLAVLWGERSWSAQNGAALQAGLRIEAGDPAPSADRFRLAPRIVARLPIVPGWAASVGAGRSFQYSQALAPAGLHVASLSSGQVWLVAGERVPAIRSDVATLGAEGWWSDGRLAAVNAFARRSTDIAVTDPAPGPLLTRHAPVYGENTAWGVELSARQIVGPVTGAVAYSWAESRMQVGQLSYAAAADRRHVFNASGLARVTPAFRLGGAASIAGGVPYTRVAGDAASCGALPGCQPDSLPWAGPPHAQRAPVYAALDLLADWGASVRGWEVGAYFQLRNVLGRENATFYAGEVLECSAAAGGTSPCDAGFGTRYERGLPRLPVIGLRVRY